MGQLTKRIYNIRKGLIRDMPSNTLLTYPEGKALYGGDASLELSRLLSASPKVMIHPTQDHAHLESLIGWDRSRYCFYCYHEGRISMYSIQDGTFTLEAIAILYENLIELGTQKTLTS